MPKVTKINDTIAFSNCMYSIKSEAVNKLTNVNHFNYHLNTMMNSGGGTGGAFPLVVPRCLGKFWDFMFINAVEEQISLPVTSEIPHEEMCLNSTLTKEAI